MNRYALSLALVLGMIGGPSMALDIHPHLLTSPDRDRLMAEYAQDHYGLGPELTLPRLIVVHCTETRDLEQTLRLFAPDGLGTSRPDLGNHGVNVGIHFVVDQDGTVYQLTPLDRMARHIVGFNHTAIGIENVAPTEARLTPAQVEANAALVAFLKDQVPSLEFLIGHHEYLLADRPHQRLWRENVVGYPKTFKRDPGPEFMAALRTLLETRYALRFSQ